MTARGDPISDWYAMGFKSDDEYQAAKKNGDPVPKWASPLVTIIARKKPT
jgi:hypothetical protein